MPLLFSYGTLCDESTQIALFGRTLYGKKATLTGFVKTLELVGDPEFARNSGKAKHAILRPASDPMSRVDGLVLSLSDRELALADAYEPIEYERVLGTLLSGEEVWVYAAKPGGT